MAVAIRIKRGLKADIESAKATLKQWEQVYATNTDEIGIYDGTNIRWQSSGGGGGLTDAPSDSKFYGRKNANWVESYDKTEIDTLIGDIGTILGDILDE